MSNLLCRTLRVVLLINYHLACYNCHISLTFRFIANLNALRIKHGPSWRYGRPLMCSCAPNPKMNLHTFDGYIEWTSYFRRISFIQIFIAINRSLTYSNLAQFGHGLGYPNKPVCTRTGMYLGYEIRRHAEICFGDGKLVCYNRPDWHFG